jgi:ABC-type antimicrobial peptide transport system permease subunit
LALLTGLFGAAAVWLAGLGICSVMISSVIRQTRDIGVRVALGATPRRVVAIVLRPLTISMLVGSIAGVCASLAVGRVLAAWLVGLSPYDLRTYLIAAGIVLVISCVAAIWPTTRALAISPATALRAPE